MRTELLYDILNETTQQFRKGEATSVKTVGPLVVGTIDMNPPVEVADGRWELVDMILLTVGVDKEAAERRKAELIVLLNDWPNDELANGPSYINVGATIGDQGAAFQLFALGQVLGLWKVITGKSFGFDDEKAEEMAGGGWVMISGYRRGDQ